LEQGRQTWVSTLAGEKRKGIGNHSGEEEAEEGTHFEVSGWKRGVTSKGR